MTNTPPPELFPQRPIRSDFTGDRRYLRRRIMTILVLVVVIGVGAYLKFWHAPSAPEEIPTIAAEGPLKEKPDQPGGIPIPNQDVTAYQQIDNSNANAKPEAEHLLPPPETPQASPATAPAPTADQTPPPSSKIETLDLPPPPKLVTTATPDKAAAPTPEAAPRAPVQEAENTAAPASSPQPPVAASPAPAPAPVATPTPPPVTATAAPASPPATPAPTAKIKTAKEATSVGKGNYRVQLASIPDEETAEADAKKLQTKYASVLGKTHLHLVKADLGSRGIYYRVQSSPLGDSEAHSMCSSLKNAGAACIIVKP
jgi:hypothetical protein